jgi:IS30 family transposase
MSWKTMERFSAEDRAKLWHDWRVGDSMTEIARALGRAVQTVYTELHSHGGISPRPWQRSARALTLAEREEISLGLAEGESQRSIAERLGRSASTINREIRRNGGVDTYRAEAAERRAAREAKRPKTCKLSENKALAATVARLLSKRWSPKQIAGWLKRKWGANEAHRVSHETIYRSLYLQARGVLKQELIKHLRSGRTLRHSVHGDKGGHRRGRLADAVSISERPPEADDRAVPGHWEGDLISGTGNSHIATLVERSTRFTLLAKVEGKDATTVAKALVRQMKRMPASLRRTLTWDRGLELAKHREIEIAAQLQIYFCDPYSPWQRGTNENTNGLLRQYFPKGTNLSVHSQAYLNKVARELNGRPRETLAFMTPAEKLQELLQ